MEINLEINGKPFQWEIDPGETLLNLLRRKGYYGVKRGCEEGYCGVCTVLIDGQALNSCMVFAAKAQGTKITTIEGLGSPQNPHHLQKTFAETGAIQCGYCSPGFILTAKALLDENPNPSEIEVKQALDGNYCRCTGYLKPIQAILTAAKTKRGE